MAVKYKTLITTAGAAKFAAATAGGTKVTLTHMAVGDGGGVLPVPDVGQTGLIGEKWRAALNKISVDARNKNYVVAELVIPPEVGGFWLREMGLYDATGTLVAVANMAESYKPELAEGSGRAQTLRMVIIISALEAVDLTVDTTTVMATQEYVDDKIAEHEQSRRHPDATLTAKGLTQLSSATDSSSEALAATPKAVKSAYDKGEAANKNADGRLAKASNLADVADKAAARKNIGLKGAAELDVGTAAGTVAAGNDTRIVNALQKGNNLSDVADKPTARANIGLRGAAVLDPQDSPTDRTAGRLLAMGAFGLGEPMGIGTTDLNTLTQPGFYCQPANANAPLSRNYPEVVAGALIVFKSGANGTTGVCQQYMPFDKPRIYYRLNDAATGKWSAWERIFSTGDRPTAAEVGAISIKGGTATGPVKIKSTDALKIYDDEYGAIFRRSETNLYIIPTPKGAGEDGGIGNLRPFSIDLATGLVRCSNGISVSTITLGDWTNFDNRYQAKGSYTPAGEAWTKNESNERFIMADAVSYAGFVSNNAAAPYMRHKPSNTLVYLATTSYPYSKGESDARYLNTLQRGSQAIVNAAHTTLTVWEAPAGCFMTGINLRADLGDARTMGFYYRSLVMKTVSGGFVQIGN